MMGDKRHSLGASTITAIPFRKGGMGPYIGGKPVR